MLNLYAALEKKERALISARTKAALAAKEAAGGTLGNPRAVEAAVKPHAANRAKGDKFAANVLRVVREIQAAIRCLEWVPPSLYSRLPLALL